MCSPWTRERGRRRATALVAVLVLGASLLAGCYGMEYRFLAVGGGGAPVAQRCGPMPFRINPHGAAGEWQLVAVVRAVQRLEAATGVDWRFQGYTSERIATGFDPRAHGGRVIVEFTTFDAPGRPAAYGHPKPSGAGDRYVGGYVYLWPSRIRALSPSGLRALVAHELGHVWGLDHADDPPEQVLMNAAPVRRDDYGNGDLAGLRALTGSCRRS